MKRGRKEAGRPHGREFSLHKKNPHTHTPLFQTPPTLISSIIFSLDRLREKDFDPVSLLLFFSLLSFDLAGEGGERGGTGKRRFVPRLPLLTHSKHPLPPLEKSFPSLSGMRHGFRGKEYWGNNEGIWMRVGKGGGVSSSFLSRASSFSFLFGFGLFKSALPFLHNSLSSSLSAPPPPFLLLFRVYFSSFPFRRGLGVEERYFLGEGWGGGRVREKKAEWKKRG